MNKFIKIIAYILLLSSCKMVGSMVESAESLFGDEVIAKVGTHKLHRSEVEKYIPAGASAEDSLALASKYIRSWATDLIFLDMAERELSDAEKDLTEEIEEYRMALLKYRYEQHYIAERLDTLVSEAEVKAYYEAQKDKFPLEVTILKARLMVIPATSRQLKTIKKLMSSQDVAEVLEADSLARQSALFYSDISQTWTDGITVAKELGTDYETLMGSISGGFAEIKDDSGNLRICYVVDIVRSGKTAPLDYCYDRIRDLIISGRKHRLLSGLEQDLIEDALAKEKFIIYEQ